MGGKGKSKGTVIKLEVRKHSASKTNSADAESGTQEGFTCVQHRTEHNKVNASKAQMGKHRQVQEGSFHDPSGTPSFLETA